MAQLVLSTAGAALGRAVLPAGFQALGAAIGRTVGAYVGGRIDAAVFGEPARVTGPRLADLQIQTSSEGAGVLRVYGRMRVTGQVIWAARFKETETTETVSGGGKGGGGRVTSTQYRYSLSFAVGLCEGAIAGVGRAWANGEELDLSQFAHRVHPGTEEQAVDPLIEAIEGAARTPAYRGLAYIVFEDLPLEQFGNVIPQLSFEVIRPAPEQAGAARLESLARGMCLIPGAGEFAYATAVVRRQTGPGEETPENAHVSAEKSDFLVALDRLAAEAPACRNVALVVGWFGDDLRAGRCTVRPKVDRAQKVTTPMTWRVAGLTRGTALVVSEVAGAPAYGGTPSDDSVIQAITELKARGYKVSLYPFLFMDVPPGNSLADPYGAAAQAAFPWRGRITGEVAPGRPGTTDLTAAATSEAAAFFGTAAAVHFSVGVSGVAYAGPAEWRYRRFVLHCAALAQAAGGVEAFLIGSELRGLTTLRSSAGVYPAVPQLRALATEVRALLPTAKLTYAADWSEYFGHQPADGSGEVRFHLDPLWADDEIDMVGVDWYPPLTDWRDGHAHLDAALGADIWDPDYLAGRIEAGEAYDWFYADLPARLAQTRTPITDGAYGEPWIYRAKDLANWWSRAHYDRPGGVRAASPTAWVAKSKPIWLTELGVPAVDKGANAPNVFIDPKSAESALPPFSSGGRDDVIQRRALEAYLRHFAPGAAGNPVSPVYGGPMVDPEGVFLWAWDARPYPAFPGRTDVWADSGNWRLGHWLSGRIGVGELGDVVADLCAAAGVASVDVTGLAGVVSGLAIEAPFTARAALEPLLAVHDAGAVESGGMLRFRSLSAGAVTALARDELVANEEGDFERIRSDGAQAPVETRLRYLDVERDWRVASISALRRDAAGAGVVDVDAPLALDAGQAQAVVDRLHARMRAERERLNLAVSERWLALEAGDRVRFADEVFRIVEAREGPRRDLSLVRDIVGPPPLIATGAPAPPPAPAAVAPYVLALDLPPLPGREGDGRPLAAVYASPWPRGAQIYAGESAGDLTFRGEARQAAIVGALEWALYPGPIGRWDEGNRVRARFLRGPLESATRRAVLDGANGFAVAHTDGRFEVLQARQVTLVGPGLYELSGFLRGLQGTEGAAAGVAPVGAAIVRLDARVARFDTAARERGASLLVRAVPAGRGPNDPTASETIFLWRDLHNRPFAPCRFRAVREASGDIRFRWIRRARLDGDAWGAGEPPLGAEREAYRVEVLSGGAPTRVLEVAAAEAIYHLSDQIADFGAPPTSLTARVAQVAEGYGPGAFRESTFVL